MSGGDLRFYTYLFFRRLPLMMVVGAVISAIGLAYIVSLPPTYRATGTILVKSGQISPKLAPVTESVGALQRFQVILQEMLTYEALLVLAKRHAIYPSGQQQLSPAETVDDLRERIHLDPVLFGGTEGALGFSVSFDAEAPEPAARIANDLISIILERDTSSRSSQANAALTFFQDETARLAQDVVSVEQRLREYKTEHLQALPDTLEFRRMLQINLRDRLLVLEREQSALHSRRAGYVEFYRQTARTDPAVEQTPEQVRLAELNAALINQRMMFAEDSSAIVGLKTQIAALQARLGAGDATEADTAALSPLDLQLAEVDDRLGAIAQEREALQKNDADLAASIEATPTNEAALSALERERSNAQTLYEAAAARLAEASTGEQIEARLQGERLTLMEPARPPEKPIGPKRLQLGLVVAAAAAIAALGTALALELLNRSVRRAADIERTLGIEVLATIPVLPARSPTRIRLPAFLTFARHRRGTVHP